MEINNQTFISGTGCRASVASEWLIPMQDACNKFGITSPNAIACFLANVGVESQSLTAFDENLNYSAAGLASTWPGRYSATMNRPYVPNALANGLARKPQQIANNVYANRMGNGGVSSGDGWKYRGQGPIQITGKQKFQDCSAAIGIDVVADPSQLAQPVAGSLSAAWFFSNAGCIAAANSSNFGLVVRLINGAYPSDANQGVLREVRRVAAISAINAQT